MQQTNENEKLIKTEILIPIREDISLGTGDLHNPYRWQLFKDRMYVDFDGYTQCPGKYEGAWKDPDTNSKIIDESLKFEIVIKKRDLDKMRSLIKDFVGSLFRQKVICFTAEGNTEFIESNRQMIKNLP